MHSQQAIRQRSVHLHPSRAMVWNRAMVPSPSSGRRATLTHAGSGASWVTLPIPGSSPAGGGTWVWGRPANLPAEVVGFEQAREGHTGWGPESYPDHPDQKKRYGHNAVRRNSQDTGLHGQASVRLSAFPRPRPQRIRGRRSRARHMVRAPRLFGPPGGCEEGRGLPGPRSRSSRRPRTRLLRPSPRPGELAPTLTRGAGTMAAAAAATQRGLRPTVPSPLPSLARSAALWET